MFHSMVVEGKKEFLKKFRLILKQGMLSTFLVAYTLQKELPQVSFLGIFRTTAPLYNFLAATYLLFIKNLFKVKRKKILGVLRV